MTGQTETNTQTDRQTDRQTYDRTDRDKHLASLANCEMPPLMESCCEWI